MSGWNLILGRGLAAASVLIVRLEGVGVAGKEAMEYTTLFVERELELGRREGVDKAPWPPCLEREATAVGDRDLLRTWGREVEASLSLSGALDLTFELPVADIVSPLGGATYRASQSRASGLNNLIAFNLIGASCAVKLSTLLCNSTVFRVLRARVGG